MYKRFEVQFPPTPKIDWCLGLMIKSFHQERNAINWNSLQKKKKKFINKKIKKKKEKEKEENVSYILGLSGETQYRYKGGHKPWEASFIHLIHKILFPILRATTSTCVNSCKIEKSLPIYTFWPKKTLTSVSVKLYIYAQLLQ